MTCAAVREIVKFGNWSDATGKSNTHYFLLRVWLSYACSIPNNNYGTSCILHGLAVLSLETGKRNEENQERDEEEILFQSDTLLGREGKRNWLDFLSKCEKYDKGKLQSRDRILGVYYILQLIYACMYVRSCHVVVGSAKNQIKMQSFVIKTYFWGAALLAPNLRIALNIYD